MYKDFKIETIIVMSNQSLNICNIIFKNIDDI